MTTPGPDDLDAEDFAALFATVRRTAVHLELRDAYTPDDPLFQRWLDGQVTPADIAEHEHEWAEIVRATVGRGVTMRRARVVSEPLAPFTRFEYDGAGVLNEAAGEQVRWLPRRQAAGLCLPANDYWVLDGRLVRFGYFSGVGDYLGAELTDDPALVEQCGSAFEAAWKRAIPHKDYRPQ
ncbi:DUF6879 family protein [Actinomadura opuntiae]|uniref:DUF6879 family protein n=1 Tax=Actinomadura sp. OS1-43 TaxID=604315 RepID=UPI00255A8F62|nr:DUF6879 family protein [Actinomadura sp. OS1-43]MDL4819094.1 hypothetical protein [Actinomadura sp. OS1-43]